MFRTTLFKTVKPFNIQKSICGTLAVTPSGVSFTAAERAALLAKYPHQVDPKAIEAALQQQSANRKFSIY